ncbi:MAG: hypothetical protein Q9P14_13025 [candidate division KSB1 bacterium]|nr:hypothetical protein [candidate division KSB1 bacterium]
MAAVVLAVFFLENILLVSGIHLSEQFSLSSILTAVYVYALGYLGLFKSEIFTTPEIANDISHFEELSDQHRIENKKQASQKYSKIRLSLLKKAEEYFRRALTLWKSVNSQYVDSNLTLEKMKRICYPYLPHNLSEIINTQLGQNFFDFINHYRVQKVKRDLADPAKKKISPILCDCLSDAGIHS